MILKFDSGPLGAGSFDVDPLDIDPFDGSGGAASSIVGTGILGP